MTDLHDSAADPPTVDTVAAQPAHRRTSRTQLCVLAVAAALAVVNMWGLTKTGGQHTTGTISGTTTVTGEQTLTDQTSSGQTDGERVSGGAAGEWRWLAVRSRAEVNYDRLGISAALDRVVVGPPHVTDEDAADRDETLNAAWLIANRLAGTGRCDESRQSCDTPPPQIGLPDTLIGGSIGATATFTYLDMLTAGDLTGGLRIAATGAVTAALVETIPAPILPVSQVARKLDEAGRAGAEIVIVPAATELSELAGDHPFQLIVADTFAEALAALCDHGSQPACTLRT